MITVTPTSWKRLKTRITSTAEAGIEIAGGLIGDQQLRLADDRARDADALLFTHRQLERRGAFPA